MEAIDRRDLAPKTRQIIGGWHSSPAMRALARSAAEEEDRAVDAMISAGEGKFTERVPVEAVQQLLVDANASAGGLFSLEIERKLADEAPTRWEVVLILERKGAEMATLLPIFDTDWYGDDLVVRVRAARDRLLLHAYPVGTVIPNLEPQSIIFSNDAVYSLGAGQQPEFVTMMDRSF